MVEAPVPPLYYSNYTVNFERAPRPKFFAWDPLDQPMATVDKWLTRL